MKLSSRFVEALTFAANLHKEQVRKGPDKVPYVSHLMLVAGTVLEFGGSETQAIAALLHDAVEDQGGERIREEILTRFGEEVTAIVDACTDASGVPKPPWRKRKEAFIASLPGVSDEAALVILADKVSNVSSTVRDLRHLREAPEVFWARFNGGREGTLWYYRSIRSAVKRGDPKVRLLGERFDLAVDELEKVA